MVDSTVIPIYTIGYGSRSLDELLGILQMYRIAYVIDVRSAPYSRFKPEFCKAPLEAFLRAHGIRYLYMGDCLGGQPADRSCYVADKVVYELVQQKPFFQEGLARLRRAFERQDRVALLCSEGKPETCHRSKLIGVSLEQRGIPVQHIDENGELRGQDDIARQLTDGQLSLFGEPAFTSRKRYRKPDRPSELADVDVEEGEDDA